MKYSIIAIKDLKIIIDKYGVPNSFDNIKDAINIIKELPGKESDYLILMYKDELFHK